MKHHEYLQYKHLRKLYFHGKSYKEIAVELNTTVNYVSQKVKDRKMNGKRNRWYNYLVLYAYRTEQQLCQVASMVGISAVTLTRVKRKLGIKTKRFAIHNKRITDLIKDQMVDLYKSGMTGSEVAQKFGYKTSKTVEDVLKEKNVESRDACFRYKYDYDFFKAVDSHDKAYILGLLYTDGYIYKDYAGFAIQLTEGDRYLLERIASRIGLDATVIHINCDNKRKYMPNTKDMARLGVYSKVLAEQVKELGVIKRKTYHLSIASNLIPKKYHYSLLRGIIDGDGSIGVDKRGVIWLKACMKSEQFAKDIRSMFPDNFSFNRYQNDYGYMYYISIIGGRSNTIRILQKMYEHKGDLYLQRKYDKISSYL